MLDNIIVGGDNEPKQYFGLWHDVSAEWSVDQTGRVIWYPARAIAEAHLHNLKERGRGKVTVKPFA